MKKVDRIGRFVHFNRDRPTYQPIDQRTDMASYRIAKARLQRDNLHLSPCFIERFSCVLWEKSVFTQTTSRVFLASISGTRRLFGVSL